LIGVGLLRLARQAAHAIRHGKAQAIQTTRRSRDMPKIGLSVNRLGKVSPGDQPDFILDAEREVDGSGSF